jgi:hypothetical protein
MSLINEALRRANQQKPASAPSSHSGVPLQPVDYRGRPESSRSLLLIPVLIVLCGLSGWFFWSASKTTHEGAAPRHALAAQAPPEIAPASQRGERLTANAPAKKNEVAIQVNTNLVVRTNFIVQAPSPAPPASPVMTVTSAPPVLAGTVTEMVTTEKTKPLPVDARPSVSPAAFPKLKLQGIYFRRTNPSVLINGRTLFVGDRVDGARVVNVDRQTVTMEFSGQTNLLTL